MAARTPRTGLTFMDPAAGAWVLVSQVYWMSWRLLDRRLYHLGISGSQARVLAILYFAEHPIKPSVVATMLFQESQSVTGILHRIEDRDLVRRHPDPSDNRAIGLELTPTGRELAREVIDISKALHSELFDKSLSAEEQRKLEASLKKVRTTAFRLPETDFKLRRAQEHKIWSE